MLHLGGRLRDLPLSQDHRPKGMPATIQEKNNSATEIPQIARILQKYVANLNQSTLPLMQDSETISSRNTPMDTTSKIGIRMSQKTRDNSTPTPPKATARNLHPSPLRPANADAMEIELYQRARTARANQKDLQGAARDRYQFLAFNQRCITTPS